MMKRFFLLLTTCSTLLGCLSIKETDKIKKTEWLLGNWKGEANGQVFYENWQKVSETEFSNINYTICNSDTIVNSRSKIEIVDGKVAYTNGKLIWPLKTINDSVVVFENTKYNERFTFRHTEKNQWYALLEYPNSKTDYFITKTSSIDELLKIKPSPIVGHFSGVMEFQKSRQSFTIDFDTLNRKQTATYNIPANLQLDRPVINVCNNGTSLSITFPDGLNDLTVMLEIKDNEMIGTLQGEWSATIRLKKESNYLPIKKNYSIVDTVLINGNVKLNANIYLPQSKNKSPAVILISGTGQHTKEEYNGWADLLASNGIAVLTYDKRNVSDFPELNIRNATTDIGFVTDLVSDAQKALDLLKSLKEITQDRIGLLGFSQGAVVAPMLASQSKDIAFVVAISGNATTDKQFIINQELNRLQERNFDHKTIETAEKIWNQLFDYAKTKLGGVELQKELDNAFDEGWGSYCLPRDIPNEDELKYLMTWNSFELTPTEYWSKLTVPSLIVYGESDRLIPVKESVELLNTTFKNKPQLLTLKVYPNADHSIKTIPDRKNFNFSHYADSYLNDLTGRCSQRWSCGNTKSIQLGDRIFLLKVGTEPKGIIAAGFATSTPFYEKHWSGENKDTLYIDVDFEVLLNPDKEPILTVDILKAGNLAKQNWRPMGSGNSIKPELVDELEAVWFDFLTTQKIRHNPFIPAENEIQKTYTEGTPNQVSVTKYERNPFARKKCLEHYGFTCVVA